MAAVESGTSTPSHAPRSARVAFIGLGRIASLLEDDPLREKPATHAGAVASRDDCMIVGGYDRAPERRTLFSRRWGAPVYASADALFASKPDIVVVATHPDSHESYVAAAARSGVSVVVCEKPLAPSLRAARRIARLERTSALRIVVNHERRFSADYRLVRRAVADGVSGRLVGVSARLYFGATARHDRVLLHDGTHMIDAIHFLTGGVISVSRTVGAPRAAVGSLYVHGRLVPCEAGAGDVGAGSATACDAKAGERGGGAAIARRWGDRRRGSHGVPVVIEVGSGRSYLMFEIVLSCTDGEIRVGNGVFDWQVAETSPYYAGYRSLRSLRRTVPQPTGYFGGMIAEAVRLWRDPHARSESSATDGTIAMEVIHRASRGW